MWRFTCQILSWGAQNNKAVCLAICSSYMVNRTFYVKLCKTSAKFNQVALEFASRPWCRFSIWTSPKSWNCKYIGGFHDQILPDYQCLAQREVTGLIIVTQNPECIGLKKIEVLLLTHKAFWLKLSKSLILRVSLTDTNLVSYLKKNHLKMIHPKNAPWSAKEFRKEAKISFKAHNIVSFLAEYHKGTRAHQHKGNNF